MLLPTQPLTLEKSLEQVQSLPASMTELNGEPEGVNVLLVRCCELGEPPRNCLATQLRRLSERKPMQTPQDAAFMKYQAMAIIWMKNHPV